MGLNYLLMGAWLSGGLLAVPDGATSASPKDDGRAAKSSEEGADAMPLEQLFAVELQFRPEMPAVVSSEGRTGRLLGSGDGHINGPRIKGRIRWSIFEDQGAGECMTNIAGVIETNDGSRIGIETRGFGVVPDPARPSRWKMNAAIQFKADGKYGWLQSVLAVWDGFFDMETGRHSYQAYTGQSDRL
jgi:hypothetical protein